MNFADVMSSLPPLERSIAPLIKWAAVKYSNEESAVISFDDLMQSGLVDLLELSRRWRGKPRADRRRLITSSLIRNMRRLVFAEYRRRGSVISIDEDFLTAGVIDDAALERFYFEELCQAVEQTLGPVHLEILGELLFPSARYLRIRDRVEVCNFMGSHSRTIKALAECFGTNWRTMRTAVDRIAVTLRGMEICVESA